MDAHYKISALCLSIRVTEKGLVVLPRHSEPSTRRLTKPGPQGPAGGEEEETKAAEMLLKLLICNLLTLVAHQGHTFSTAGLSLCENLQFLTSVDKRSQRVFIYKRAQNRNARHQACPCLASENANTVQINSCWETVEVQGDKKAK